MHATIKASAVALIAAMALPTVPRDAPPPGAGGAPTASSAPAGATAAAVGASARSVDADPAPPPERPADAADPGPAPAAPPAPARAPIRAALAGLEIANGDRLRLGFYETVDLGGAAGAGREPEAEGALRTFIQRTDIGGEYTVEGNGLVSVPLLGDFRAAGRDVEDLRADLAAAFEAVIGRRARVEAKIVDRSPVYVVGAVRNPGAVRYTAGMFVLQAVALAGGLDRDGGSAEIEGARERERLRLAILQIERLTARRARLEAERGGTFDASSSGAPMRAILISRSEPPAPRARPTAPDAESFAAAESEILRAETARRRQRQGVLAARVEAARQEVEAIRTKLEQFELEKAMRAERLDAMQRLRDRGVDTSDHVLTLRTELADIEARRQDGRVTLVDAEARLAEAAEDARREQLEFALDLAKEIATVDKDIAEAREAAGSSQSVAALLARSAGGRAPPRYEIVRETLNGAVRLPASETSPLMPGDVLKLK